MIQRLESIQPSRILLRMLKPFYPGIETLSNQIERQIEALNNKIDQFNELTDPIEQKEQLYEIYHEQKKIDNQYPDSLISMWPDYRNQLHDQLFSSLQKEFKALGIESFQEDLSIDLDTKPAEFFTERSSSLPAIISNLPPDKANQFLAMLLADQPLVNLYLPGEENEPGYDAYQQFIQRHSIEMIGGKVVNCKNFKVTDGLSGTDYLLKVDNRLGMPKEAEAHLRQTQAREHLTPVYAERPVFCPEDGIDTMRTLIVTEYCHQGNLLSYAAELAESEESPEKKAILAANIFEQLVMIIDQIQTAGCGFTDPKLSNCLLDKDQRLKISDTKSLIYLDEDFIYRAGDPKNQWNGILIHTPEYDSPELTDVVADPATHSRVLSADAMHAFILGKNLYQFLTNCETSYLTHKSSYEDYDFSDPIFRTKTGEQLKSLIEQTIIETPEARITIRAFLTELQRINLLEQKEENYIHKTTEYKEAIKELGEKETTDEEPPIDHIP